jgi:hypothetical protein
MLARQDHRVDLREDLDPHPVCLRGRGVPPGRTADLPRPARQPDRAQGVVRRHRRVLGRLYDAIEFRGSRHEDCETLAAVCRGARLQRPHRHLAPHSGAVRHRHHGRALGQAGRRRSPTPMSGTPATTWATRCSSPAPCRGWTCGSSRPRQLWPTDEIVGHARRLAEQTGARIASPRTSTRGVAGVDFVHTDVWVSMGEPDAVWGERIELLTPYQVTPRSWRPPANPATKFMHCLPSFHNRETAVGERIFAEFGSTAMEVTDEVFESPASIVFDQRQRHPQCRHRRPRRPRQDHPRRQDALAGRRLRRARPCRRPRDGLRRPGAREGHHDPRQEHRVHYNGPVGRAAGTPRGDDQHHRHPRPRRLRRRGRARPVDGRRRRAARRRLRGPAAADPLRAAQGPGRPPAGRAVHQQGGPPRRRIAEVVDEVYELFMDLIEDDRAHHHDRLEFPIVYASAKAGRASLERPPTAACPTARPGAALQDDHRHIPAPTYDDGRPLQAHVTNLDSSQLPRPPRAAARAQRQIRKGQQVAWCRHDGSIRRSSHRAAHDRGPGAQAAGRRDRRPRATSSPSPASPTS